MNELIFSPSIIGLAALLVLNFLAFCWAVQRSYDTIDAAYGRWSAAESDTIPAPPWADVDVEFPQEGRSGVRDLAWSDQDFVSPTEMAVGDGLEHRRDCIRPSAPGWTEDEP